LATILLIDDDADLVEACKMVIAGRGHEVKSARSAAEARELLKGGRPDAIVLDVMMETKDSGFDLAREVQQRFPGLPIVLLTSVHDAVPPSMRFEPDETWLPVIRFLEKPVDPAVLADEIDGMLAG